MRNSKRRSPSPEGAEVCSQGREPLVTDPPVTPAPEGGGGAALRIRDLPPRWGSANSARSLSRGLRPWLQTIAPPELALPTGLASCHSALTRVRPR